MFEQEFGTIIGVFIGGLVLGVILTLLINKVRSGSASPTTIKREMEDYQDKVEAHFDETSEKFKQMATQYQDLYKHLSVGATTLCRPENISPGLTADKDPLSNNLAIDKKPADGSLKEKTKGSDSKVDPTDEKIKADLAKLKADQAKAKQGAEVKTADKPVEKVETKPAEKGSNNKA